MNEAKPVASLSSSLLARKGAARPAMRPQIQLTGRSVKFGTLARSEPHDDDLGWNDMGEDAPGNLAANLPATASDRAVVVPLVKAGKRKFAALAHVEPKPSVTPPQVQSTRRKALTVRVEPERHMQLRLACTVQNRTAQSLLSEALDRMLADIPGVREFAGRIRQDG